MVIDSHVHLYWPQVNDDPSGWAVARGETHWADLATRRRKNGVAVQSFPSVEGLLRAMEGAGVDRAVLLGWYWETARSCEEQNAFFAACIKAQPERLAACVTVFPPAGVDHVEREFRRAADAGFQGVGELSPHAQGYAIDHPAFERVLTLAGEAGWPVNLHVTDPQARPYPGQVPTPLDDFDRLAQRFPQTTFILAHWGGFPPWRHANVYFDTAASPLSHGVDIWRRGSEELGEERVLFGSDFPLHLYPRLEDGPALARVVREVRAAGAASEAALLGGTATRWFGPRVR